MHHVGGLWVLLVLIRSYIVGIMPRNSAGPRSHRGDSVALVIELLESDRPPEVVTISSYFLLFIIIMYSRPSLIARHLLANLLGNLRGIPQLIPKLGNFPSQIALLGAK